MSGIRSQGSHLFYASAPTAATRIVKVSSINGLGGPRDQIDASTLDEIEDALYEGGLGRPGPVTLSVVMQKGEVAHETLFALKSAGTTHSWGIYGPQSATPPTVIGSVMQESTTRTSIRFNGFVSDVNIDISGNDLWRGTVTIQRSGPVIVDLMVS